MTRSRRQFSQEFKNDAAKLVLDKNYSLQKAAESLNIGASTLGKWVAQMKNQQEDRSIKGKSLSSDQKEKKALEDRIKQLEWENTILKKATALVMSDSLKK